MINKMLHLQSIFNTNNSDVEDIDIFNNATYGTLYDHVISYVISNPTTPPRMFSDTSPKIIRAGVVSIP